MLMNFFLVVFGQDLIIFSFIICVIFIIIVDNHFKENIGLSTG